MSQKLNYVRIATNLDWRRKMSKQKINGYWYSSYNGKIVLLDKEYEFVAEVEQ